MKGYARAAIVAVLSIGIAMVLSFLPSREDAGMTGRDQAVFQPEKPIRLTSDNLVDGLAGLPLDLPLARVDFQRSVLSVDLFLENGMGEPDSVYHDLYELSRFAWDSTTNVDEVLVRVLAVEKGSRRMKELMVAMDARREQSDAGSFPVSGEMKVKDFLQSRYQITYTQKWKSQF